MSESKNPPNEILVPNRYHPGNNRRSFDDFFELATGPVPPPPALEDGPPLGLAKYYLVPCCPVAGSYSLPDGLINLIVDCASTMATQADKDIFLGRQKAPVALAMRESVTPEFEHPMKAFASLYLATQFEFYFRFLSGLLHPDGSWKSPADQQTAKLLLPADNRINRSRVYDVELAYQLMVLKNGDPRAALLKSLDTAIRSRFQSSIYDNLGGRIKFVRNRGAHGQWGDVSAEGVFYATLTAILYLASP
jgi:hypothetical protein